MTNHKQEATNNGGLKSDVERRIRNNALRSILTASGLGFVLGGGLKTRPGRHLLGYAGRVAVRELFLASLFRGGLTILLSGRGSDGTSNGHTPEPSARL
jgi:hypothetical protein